MTTYNHIIMIMFFNIEMNKDMSAIEIAVAVDVSQLT